MTKKISLSFINKGKKFEIPRFTVGKQEEMLEKTLELEKKIKNERERNKKLEKYLIVSTLQDIDETVSEEDINNMHPSDYVYLAGLIWNEGRELTDDAGNFREKKK